MPILFDPNEAFAAQNTKPVLKASEYDKRITGSGAGKVGRFNSTTNPFADINNAPAVKAEYDRNLRTPMLQAVRQVKSNIGQGTRTIIPIHPLTERLITHVARNTFHNPSSHFTPQALPVMKSEMTMDLWDVLGVDNADRNVYITIMPQSVALDDTEVVIGNDVEKEKTNHIIYRVDILVTDKNLDDVTDAVYVTHDMINSSSFTDDILIVNYLDQVSVENYVYEIIDELSDSRLDITKRPMLDTDDKVVINEWFNKNYSITKAMVELLHITHGTQDNGKDIVDIFLDIFAVLYEKHASTSVNVDLNSVALNLRLFESFQISLEMYAKLYNGMRDIEQRHHANHDGTQEINALIRQNVQLQLNSNLFGLNDKRDQLATVPDNKNYVCDPRFSPQQRAAVTTTDPLVIVQAGAGTGKSTVILERIKYLSQSGVNPSDITVLSFTNAAADNITQRNPQVVSKTTAKMISETYEKAYPQHKISSVPTMLNAIDIYYKGNSAVNEFLTKFKTYLRSIDSDASNANMTMLSSFVENNFDQVIEVLDTIKQTTLELEIIIAYLRIDQMKEPFTPPKHLIIDEVQDNSSFEFVYMLLFAAKHNSTLYLVGDSSQTLYEFRSANPKALNALEASGVFSAYQLTTNYRSNQAILDYANVGLSQIPSNQYAKIQLQASDLNQITPDEFKDKVRIIINPYSSREYNREIDNVVRNIHVRNYIDEVLNRGETVTILGFTRREVKAAEAWVREIYPQKKVFNLTADLPFNYTLFSDYVSKYWEEIVVVPPKFAPSMFTNGLIQNIASLLPIKRFGNNGAKKAENIAIDRAQKWWAESQHTINAWLNAIDANQMTNEEFFDALRENILQFEINNNAISNALTFNRNKKRKAELGQTKPDIMVSTIHGVKGLEFDNVVLYLQPDTPGRLADDSYKRLIYVALTRAKNTELIVKAAPGNPDKVPMMIDYNVVVNRLEEIQQQQANATIDDDDDTADDDGATTTVPTANDDKD